MKYSITIMNDFKEKSSLFDENSKEKHFRTIMSPQGHQKTV